MNHWQWQRTQLLSVYTTTLPPSLLTRETASIWPFGRICSALRIKASTAGCAISASYGKQRSLPCRLPPVLRRTQRHRRQAATSQVRDPSTTPDQNKSMRWRVNLLTASVSAEFGDRQGMYAHLPADDRELHFIHITKTSGTAVEELGRRFGHKWGRYDLGCFRWYVLCDK